MDPSDILTGDAERDRRDVAILMESVAELFGPLGLEEVSRRAVDRAILLTGAERGILLLDDGEGRLVVRVAQGRKRRVLSTDTIPDAHDAEDQICGKDRLRASLVAHARRRVAARDVLDSVSGTPSPSPQDGPWTTT